jgi:hypothetical protein
MRNSSKQLPKATGPIPLEPFTAGCTFASYRHRLQTSSPFS